VGGGLLCRSAVYALLLNLVVEENGNVIREVFNILLFSINSKFRCEEIEEVARVWERELNELRNFSFLEKDLLETEIEQMKEDRANLKAKLAQYEAEIAQTKEEKCKLRENVALSSLLSMYYICTR
jgi:uncharacterized protein YlxW (UPF0749 family)